MTIISPEKIGISNNNKWYLYWPGSYYILGRSTGVVWAQ